MESNHPFLHVRQASSPLDHGIVSSRDGSRTHRFTRLSTWPLCQIAYSAASCRSGSRTRQAEVMSLCWALAHLRQIRVTKGRVELPCLAARRSERRVSTCCTTWSCDPCGNRTRLFSLRGWSPTDRRTGQIECAGQELNLQCSKAGGLRPPRLANAQPTHVFSGTGRSRTDRQHHQGLSLAAFPVCVPRHKRPR